MPPLPDNPELRALSYLAQYPELTKFLIDAVGITEDDFTCDAHREAFRRLAAEPNPATVYRLSIAVKCLPQLSDNKFLDFFLALAPSTATIIADFRDLCTATCTRDRNRELSNIMARNLEPEVFQSSMESTMAQVMEHYERRRNILSTLTLPSSSAPSPTHNSQLTTHNSPVPSSPSPVPPSLLSIPGFINDLTDYTLQTAPRPNRVLAFAGALTLLAHLAGRKFYGPGDTFPNLYIIALAESAFGKDHPRKVAKRIAAEVHISSSVIQNVASGQALEDALLRLPTLLCQFDEFDSVLREIKNEAKTSPAMESLWRTLLSVFTSSSSTLTTRLRAVGQNKSAGGEDIHHPSFTVFATAIPENFYGALSMRALTGGLFGRFLVIEAGERGDRNKNAGLEDHPIPYFLMQKITYLASLPPRIMDTYPVPPRKVDYADDAASAAIDRVGDESDALYKSEGAGEMERSLWGRSVEHVQKLALLYALSCDLENPKITVEAVDWAWRFVKCVQERMMGMAHDYVANSAKEADILKALRILKKAGKRGMRHSALLRAMAIDALAMSEIIQTLEERDDIIVEIPPTSTKRGKRYKIKERAKK